MNRKCDNRLEVVQELFALLTAFSDDAVDVALRGQSCSAPGAIARYADYLREAGQRIIVIADAVGAISLR